MIKVLSYKILLQLFLTVILLNIINGLGRINLLWPPNHDASLFKVAGLNDIYVLLIQDLEHQSLLPHLSYAPYFYLFSHVV